MSLLILALTPAFGQAPLTPATIIGTAAKRVPISQHSPRYEHLRSQLVESAGAMDDLSHSIQGDHESTVCTSPIAPLVKESIDYSKEYVVLVRHSDDISNQIAIATSLDRTLNTLAVTIHSSRSLYGYDESYHHCFALVVPRSLATSIVIKDSFAPRQIYWTWFGPVFIDRTTDDIWLNSKQVLDNNEMHRSRKYRVGSDYAG